MQSVKNNYNNRKSEIQVYFEFISLVITNNSRIEMPNNTLIPINTDITSIFKSNLILLLYNITESVVTEIVKYIHDDLLCSKRVAFSSLIDDLQKMVLHHHHQMIKESSNNQEKLVDHIHELSLIAINDRFFALSFKDYIGSTGNSFGGSLDARKIRSVMKKYGIIITKENEELRNIKELRNKLAHGESSFCEACRDLPLSYLNKLKDSTFEFLDHILALSLNYAEKTLYLRS